MEEVDTITVAVSGIDINKVEPLDTRRLVTFINHYLATTVSFLNHFATQCESKLDRMQQQLHRVECRLKLLECKLASIPGIPSTPTVEGAVPSTTSSKGAPVPGPSSNFNLSQQPQSSSQAAPPPPPPPPAPPLPPKSESSDASCSSSASSSLPNHNNSLSSTEKQANGDDAAYGDGEDDHDGKEENKSVVAGTNASAPSTSTSARDDPRYAKYFKMVTVGVPVQAVKQKMLTEGVDPAILDN